MKLFGFNITKNKGIESETFQAFSTPFSKVGAGNLSLPIIDDRFSNPQGYIRFGNDNLFPQLLTQLYYSSPLHSAIVDFKTNAATGGGFQIETKGLSVKENVKLKAFLQGMNFDKIVGGSLVKNWLLHKRVYFKVWVKNGEVTRAEQICPTKVRKDKKGDKYFICEHWEYQQGIQTIMPYRRDVSEGCYLLAFEEELMGVSTYPIPSYSTANNWIFLDGEMSHFHKSNIQNSIFPSFAMFFPKKPQSEEEKNMIKDSISKLKGAENAGKAAAFFANDKEDLPSIEALPINNNDQLFNQTTESIENKICQAHTIDPILMGIRVSGKLGSGTDIKQAYTIFEKNVVMPLRRDIEYIVNRLTDVAGFTVPFVINDYQIVNENIIEIEDEGSKTIDALNSMSPLVASKVLDNLTVNEIRSLGGLNPVKGGENIKDKGDNNENVNVNI